MSDAEKILDTELVEIQSKVKAIKPGAEEAFGRGVARGLAGPTVDIIDRAAGLEEGTKELMEENPMAALAGNVAGFAGGAATGTGLGGLLTKAGSAATKKYGKNALAKLAVGATEGATIGLAEGTSQAALDNKLDLPGASAMIAQSAGMGLAFGGGLSAAGSVLNRTNNWLFKKTFDKNLKNMAKLKERRLKANNTYNAYKDELLALEQTGQIDSQRYASILGKPIAGQPGRKVMRSSGGREAGYIKSSGFKTEAPIWKAMKEMDAADEAIRTNTESALTTLAKDSQSVVRNVGTAVSMAGANAMGMHGGGIAMRMLFPKIVDGIGAKVIAGLRGVKPIRKLIGRSLKRGEITMGQTLATRGGFVSQDMAGSTSIKALLRSLKVPLIHYMTDDDYKDVLQEIEEADVGSYELSLRGALMSHGVPQELLNEHVASQVRAVQYLQQTAPQAPDSQWISESGHTPIISDEMKLRFVRRLRAVGAPSSVISDFLKGELNPDSSEAWHVVYPEHASQLAEVIENNVEIALAHGKKFTAQEQRQIALMTGPYNTKNGRKNSHNLIQSLQGNYEQPQEAQPQPQNRGNMNMSGVNNQYLTQSQLTQKNINTRG